MNQKNTKKKKTEDVQNMDEFLADEQPLDEEEVEWEDK